MGKSKGGKYPKPGRYRGPNAAAGDDDAGSDDEDKKFQPKSRGLGGQSNTVGMLPPSDSEEEEEGEEGENVPKPKPAEAPKPPPPTRAAAAKKDSDSEESSSEEDESDSESDDGKPAPVNDYLTAPRQPKKVATTEERDPETIRKDLERLELIRKRREEDRQKRIRMEGWDRFAPVSDTNRPPGHVPSDHPSQKA